MTMLITRFHKLIQSKLLWIIFFVVIVFSFVIWAMPWPSRYSDSRDGDAAGILYGKGVSRDQFRDAYANTYLSLAMAIGRPPKLDREMQRELRKSAWRNIVTVREADKMQIPVTDKEVIAAIQQQPAFVDNGRFVPQAYQAFIANFLGPMGVTDRQFEDFMRQRLLAMKLRSFVSQGILISPYEQKRTISSMSDVFDIDYVNVQPAAQKCEVNLTANDIRQYFETNKADFTVPTKVQVRYVKLPVAGCTNSIEPTEDEALSYYNDHLDEFVDKTSTNKPVQAQNIAATATKGTETTYKPFDDVKTNIFTHLSKEKARESLSDEATDFVSSLAPTRKGNAPDFNTLAEKRGWQVYTSEFFAAKDEVTGIDAGAEFNRAAFTLRPTPDESFSDVVLGKDYVYVMSLVKRTESHLPTYEEVTVEAARAATEHARKEVVAKKAEEIRNAIQTELNNKKSFAEAVQPYGLTVSTVTNVSVASQYQETNNVMGYARFMLPEVIYKSQNEISDLIPVGKEVLLAHVSKRQPASEQVVTALKPQIVNSLRQERSDQLFSEYQDELLQNASFKDNEANLYTEEEKEEPQD